MTAPRCVLVTGASGLVGGRLVAWARERGAAVRALVRRPAADAVGAVGATDAGGAVGAVGAVGATDAGAPDVAVVRGDLREPGVAERALDGVDVVLHCAGVMERGADPAEMEAVNATATRALVTAARRAGVRRFVHVSTVAVYGRGDLLGVDEQRAPAPVGDYAVTKWRGEQAVRGTDGLEWVVLRPCGVYGPGERRVLPYLAAVVQHGRVPLLRGGRVVYDLVHVDDVCQALWLAATVERAAGQTFNVAEGVRREAHQIVAALADALGCESRRVRVGPLRAWAWNAVAGGLHRVLGARGPVPLDPVLLAMQREHRHFDVRRAREVLGYAPARALPEALAEIVALARGGGAAR